MVQWHTAFQLKRLPSRHGEGLTSLPDPFLLSLSLIGATTVTPIAVAGGEIACAHGASKRRARAAACCTAGPSITACGRRRCARSPRDRLVLAPDRRGFGASSAPADLAREAEDVAAVLDHFSVARAVIVGMSQAGRVALDFALRYPERAAALVLQGAPLAGVTPGPDESETIPIVEYAALARAARLDEMKRRWLAHPLMRTHSPAATRAARAMLDAYEGRDLAAISYLRDAEAHDLARIKAPALIITGALDTPWRRRASDALARALPEATRAEIAEAGHLCNLDRPEAYNAALAALLARTT